MKIWFRRHREFDADLIRPVLPGSILYLGNQTSEFHRYGDRFEDNRAFLRINFGFRDDLPVETETNSIGPWLTFELPDHDPERPGGHRFHSPVTI